MTLKVKLIIGVVVLLILAGGGYYAYGKIGDRAIAKAKEKIEVLTNAMNGLRDSMVTRESQWTNKESGYKDKISALNNRLSNLQKERDGLAKKYEDLERQRANVSVPNAPDSIVDDFRKAGYRSSTRVNRAKR